MKIIIIKTVKKFTLTVPRDPALPVYTGTLTGDKTTVMIGEEFQVVIKLDAQNATTFNAYRITLSFTPSKLEYLSISDPSSTVVLDGGKLVISGIGTERPITDTITVTFRAKKSGVTDIKLASVEMDLDPNATLENLPMMKVANGSVSIDVQKVEDEAEVPVETEKKDSDATWLIVGIAAAILVVAGVVVVIVVKKKKQRPAKEN